MSQVEAVFRNGVFQPIGRVDLKENQRVRLSFQAVDAGTAGAWLSNLARLHRPVLERVGPLSDSAADIAADRRR